MNLPAPRTMAQAVKPLILINWLFGFGVIQYPTGRPRPLISALWSILLFLAYLSFVLMADFSRLFESHGSKLAANSFRLSAYFFVVFIAVCMCLAHGRDEVTRRTLSKLTDVNGRLKSLGVPDDYRTTLMSQIVELFAAFSSIVTIVVMDLVCIDMNFSSETARLGFFTTYHYFMAFAFIVDCSFSGFIRYFRNRFQRLNQLIAESDSRYRIEATSSDGRFPSYSTLIREIHGHNLRLIRAANKRWLFNVVSETRRIHWDLCKTATELNRAYGVQVLFSVASSFGLMTTFLYTIYALAVSQFLNDSVLTTWIDNIVLLMWLAFFVTKILMIADACDSASREANRTGGLISKLLNTRACDEDIRDEINIFMLQLVQNPLNFTASGFFALNYSMVHGIIGSVTTYLVILIQMQNHYESENVNFITLNSTIQVQLNGTD